MFPNLNAEQARRRLTNADVANKLSIDRNTYESKKRTGRFYRSECITLCKMFNCSFEYLFSEVSDCDSK